MELTGAWRDEWDVWFPPASIGPGGLIYAPRRAAIDTETYQGNRAARRKAAAQARRKKP